jgi:hypothetical protein
VIVGIVIGAIGGLVILGLLVFLISRRRRKSTTTTTTSHENKDDWNKAELEAVEVKLVELPAERDPEELEGPPRPPFELSAEPTTTT